MNFDEAKTFLMDGYSRADLEVSTEDKQLIIHYRDFEFHVLEEDISEYADMYDFLSTLAVMPTECSVCSTSYREQVVTPLDPVRVRIPLHLPSGFVFGEPSDEGIYVEISRASSYFQNYFRSDEAYLQFCLDIMRRPYMRGAERGVDITDIRRYMYVPTTIRVHNMSEASVQAAVKRSSLLIEACLFELSYLKGLPLGLAEEWPRHQPRTRPFRFGDSVPGNELPLPSVTFNSDIVRFYQRGMSTNDPVTQFLSFYQVMEYFFLTVTDEQLYAKLSRRINDPRFSTTDRNLDRIIQEVIEHRRTTDQTEMLKAVLGKFVDENELIEFIKAYEEHLGEKLYTKRKTIFGVDMAEVRLTPGHVFGNISERITTIRNAIVHSSDQYERQERYIPLTTTSERLIGRDIPLLKFLAERVIIATAMN